MLGIRGQRVGTRLGIRAGVWWARFGIRDRHGWGLLSLGVLWGFSE